MSEPRKLELVFLWHMHQPDYRDHATGEFRRPWTYLHALKDYTDMAAHLERHPQVRAVVNFVPVLLDQIEDYVRQFDAGEFRDPLLRLLARESLDRIGEDERRLVLATCLPGNHARMVAPYPRYERLHHLYRAVEGQGAAVVDYLSGAFFADLLVWYHLVWTGETERRNRALLAELMSKGEGFSHSDRRRLLEMMAETLRGLVPRYRALAARGQIELSATPDTHPLAPLLLDFASAREAQPDMALPQAHFYPGGRARVDRHIALARDSHARRFGQAPAGMWPAEGALSDALIRQLAAQGCRWAASSQSVLANSQRRDNVAASGQPHAGPDAAPERGVEQDHVDRARRRVGCELFEVHDDRVGRERNPDEVAQRLHRRDAVDRILVVVVAQVLDRPPEVHGVVEGERAVGVVAQALAGQRLRERAVALELVRGGKDPALELVRAEAVLRLEVEGVRDELFGRADLAAAGLRIRVAEEQVARERDAIVEPAAQEVADRHAELAADDVEAGELERRVELRAVVVEARGRIADLEPHRLEREHVVPGEVAFERSERARGVLAAAAHLAQTHVAVGGLDFDDGADEPAPVCAVAVPQRRLEGHRDRRGADASDRRGGHRAARTRASRRRDPGRGL